MQIIKITFSRLSKKEILRRCIFSPLLILTVKYALTRKILKYLFSTRKVKAALETGHVDVNEINSQVLVEEILENDVGIGYVRRFSCGGFCLTSHWQGETLMHVSARHGNKNLIKVHASISLVRVAIYSIDV
jgi:hypothetical protein